MPRTGRPRALDEPKRREICALISAGCGFDGAARYVGCATSTIRREASRNADFNEQLRQANLAAELIPLNALRRAASTHWRAAAWLLERTNTQRFARQNVRLLKPEQIRYFIDVMAEELLGTAKDQGARERMIRKMNKVVAELDREARDEFFNPFPKDRRPRKRPIELADVPSRRPLANDESLAHEASSIRGAVALPSANNLPVQSNENDAPN